jgi:type IV pilus assembly protein PilA
MQRIRRRLQSEKGFTLIELLVVILIIGILAAIAIPSFLGQKDKATDAQAMSQARSAQTAIETYATSHNGAYTSADPGALQKIEPTLNDNPAGLKVDSADGDSYKLTVTSGTGTTFSIARTSDGKTTRTCDPSDTGECGNGTWGANPASASGGTSTTEG